MSSGITSEYIDNKVFKVLKQIAEAIQKISIRRYKGLHRSLRRKVIGSSSRHGLPADLPVLRWVAARPYKLSTASTIFRHLYTRTYPQARLKHLKLSKTDLPTWP
jgi:hypothetical protein